MSQSKTSINILIFVFATLISFLTLEFVADVYIVHFANRGRTLKYASLNQYKRYMKRGGGLPLATPHRYLGYSNTPNYTAGTNKHNKLGFRGDDFVQPKPSNEFRIVCLGGSTTYTKGVKDYRKAYPALLKKELHDRGYDSVNVINSGTIGWGSLESMLNFQLRILDLEPDLVIIYHAINDIHPRFVWPPEAYNRGDNSGYRAPHNLFYKRYWFEHSTVLRGLAIRLGYISSPLDTTRNIDPRAPTSYAREFWIQKQRGIYPAGIFKKVSAKQMLDANKPTYFRRNVENIITIAKSRSIKVMLVTFVFSPLFETHPRVSSDEYISAYEEMNSVLKEIAADTEVSFYDFARDFPIDKDYFTDGRHVTEKGSRLKAKLFAKFIIENNLINRD